MSQLKKIKFSSIEDFKNAASNGELDNETIWITPNEEKEEVIIATIDDGTGVSVNINGTQRIIYVPMMTDSIIQALGSSNKPKFVYYHEQMCNVIGSSLDTLVMLYYDYATSAVLKLLYNEGYSDPLETTVLGGSSSGSQAGKIGLNIHQITLPTWEGEPSESNQQPVAFPTFNLFTDSSIDFISSLQELFLAGMKGLTYNDPSSVVYRLTATNGKDSLEFRIMDGMADYSVYVSDNNPQQITIYGDGTYNNSKYHIEIVDEIVRL